MRANNRSQFRWTAINFWSRSGQVRFIRCPNPVRKKREGDVIVFSKNEIYVFHQLHEANNNRFEEATGKIQWRKNMLNLIKKVLIEV